MKIKSVVNFRVDECLKKSAKEVFDSLGLPMNIVVALFFRQCILHESLPFEAELLNAYKLEEGKSLTVSLKVDKDLKEKADSLFEDLGLTTTGAILLFLNQCVMYGKLPFELNIKEIKCTYLIKS